MLRLPAGSAGDSGGEMRGMMRRLLEQSSSDRTVQVYSLYPPLAPPAVAAGGQGGSGDVRKPPPPAYSIMDSRENARISPSASVDYDIMPYQSTSFPVGAGGGYPSYTSQPRPEAAGLRFWSAQARESQQPEAGLYREISRLQEQVRKLEVSGGMGGVTSPAAAGGARVQTLMYSASDIQSVLFAGAAKPPAPSAGGESASVPAPPPAAPAKPADAAVGAPPADDTADKARFGDMYDDAQAASKALQTHGELVGDLYAKIWELQKENALLKQKITEDEAAYAQAVLEKRQVDARVVELEGVVTSSNDHIRNLRQMNTGLGVALHEILAAPSLSDVQQMVHRFLGAFFQPPSAPGPSA